MSIEYRPCEEKEAAGSYNSQVRRAVGRRQETRRKTMATDECWKQDGVRVIPATELDPNTAQTPGMDRKGGGPWLASNAGMPPVSCAGCQALQRCLRRQLDKATCTGKRLACALWSHRSTHSNVSTLRASVAPTDAAKGRWLSCFGSLGLSSRVHLSPSALICTFATFGS
jgi:hypothetical protein